MTKFKQKQVKKKRKKVSFSTLCWELVSIRNHCLIPGNMYFPKQSGSFMKLYFNLLRSGTILMIVIAKARK